MAEAISIPKDKSSFPEHLDFYKLRELGLQHIKELGSEIWTDHNLHDPGITILEVLCYAVTDLGYRTNFDIKDLLARSMDNKREAEKTIFNQPYDDNFYSAAHILSCNPLTVTDYRKLFIDIPGVKNAWLEKAKTQEVRIGLSTKNELYALPPDADKVQNGEINGEDDCKQTEIKLNGLYDICVEIEPIDTIDECGRAVQSREDIIKRVYEVFHMHRNLCEDVRDVCVYGEEEIAICADIELSAEADPEEVMLQICLEVEEFLSPTLRFYTLQEMLEKGKSVEEIFEGRPLTPYQDNTKNGTNCLPLMPSRGFIDVEELKKLDPKTKLHVSDVHGVIMQVPGVQAIHRLYLVNYINQQPQTRGEEWCIDLTKGYKPHIGIKSSKVNFLKGPLYFTYNLDVLLQRFAEEKNARLKACLEPYQLDLPIPEGTYHDLKDYTSILHEFPVTYGVGNNGISQPPTKLRIAQSRQLKAYLLFFDQILANYLSQLAHIRDLFAMRSDGHISREETTSTYFSQTLKDIPGAEELIKNFEACQEQCSNETVPEDYPAYLSYITEKEDVYQKRRNQFLDHLLARFSESFTDYVMQMYKLQKADRDEKEIIDNKAAFLENYPKISRDRGKAFDILKRPVWDTPNVAGLKKRISALLGIKNSDRHTLSNGEKLNIPQSYRIQYTACDGITLKSKQHFEKAAGAQQRAQELSPLLADKSQYQILKYSIPALQGYGYTIIDDNGTPIVKSVEHFTSIQSLNDQINNVIQHFVNEEVVYQFPYAPERYKYEVSIDGKKILESQNDYYTNESAATSINLLKKKAVNKEKYCRVPAEVEDACEYTFALTEDIEEHATILLQSNRYYTYDSCKAAMECFISKTVWNGITTPPDVENKWEETECFEYWVYNAPKEKIIFKSYRGYKTRDKALHFYNEQGKLESGYERFLELGEDIDFYNNTEKNGKYGFELLREKPGELSTSRFEIFRGKNNQYYFRLKAANHKIILQSEGYKSLQGCKNGIRSVQLNSQNDSSFERRVARNTQDYFVLKAKNGEIIGVSETYTSREGMENGIESVKKNAAGTSDLLTVKIEAVHPFYYDTQQEREDRKWAIKYYLDKEPYQPAVIGGDPGDFIITLRNKEGKDILVSPPENAGFVYKTEKIARNESLRIRRRAGVEKKKHYILLNDLEGPLPFSFQIKDGDNNVIAEHPHKYATAEERDLAIEELTEGARNQVASYRYIEEEEGYRFELLSMAYEVIMRSEKLYGSIRACETGWNDMLKNACAQSNYKLKEDYPYSFSLLDSRKNIIANHTKSYNTKSERDQALQSVMNYACYTGFRENIFGTQGSYTFELRGKKDQVLLISSHPYPDEPSALASFKTMVQQARDRANYIYPADNFRFEIVDENNTALATPPATYEFASENERNAAIELIIAYLRKDEVKHEIENVGGAFYGFITDHHHNMLLTGSILSPSKKTAQPVLDELKASAADPGNYQPTDSENDICRFGFQVVKQNDEPVATHPVKFHTEEARNKAQLNVLSWVTDYKKLKDNILAIHKWKDLKNWQDLVLLRIDREYLDSHTLEDFKQLSLDKDRYQVVKKGSGIMLELKDAYGQLVAKHTGHINSEKDANDLKEQIMLYIKLNAHWFQAPTQHKNFIVHNELGEEILVGTEGYRSKDWLLKAYELGVNIAYYKKVDSKPDGGSVENSETSTDDDNNKYGFELLYGDKILATHPRKYDESGQRDVALNQTIEALQKNWLNDKMQTEVETYYYQLNDFTDEVLLSSKNLKEFATKTEAEDNYETLIQLALDANSYQSVFQYKPATAGNKQCFYSFVINNSLEENNERLFEHGAEYDCQKTRDDVLQTIVELLNVKNFMASTNDTVCGYYFEFTHTHQPTPEGDPIDITMKSAMHYPTVGKAWQAINELATLMKDTEKYVEPDEDNNEAMWAIINDSGHTVAYVSASGNADEIKDILIEYLTGIEQKVIDQLKSKKVVTSISGTEDGCMFEHTYFCEDYFEKGNGEGVSTDVRVKGTISYSTRGEAKEAIEKLAELMKSEDSYHPPQENSGATLAIQDSEENELALLFAEADAEDIKTALIQCLTDMEKQVTFGLESLWPTIQYQLKDNEEVLIKSVSGHDDEPCLKPSDEEFCEKSDLISSLGQKDEFYRTISSVDQCLHGFELLDNNGGILACHDKLYYSTSQSTNEINRIKALLNNEGMHLVEHILLRPRDISLPPQYHFVVKNNDDEILLRGKLPGEGEQDTFKNALSEFKNYIRQFEDYTGPSDTDTSLKSYDSSEVYETDTSKVCTVQKFKMVIDGEDEAFSEKAYSNNDELIKDMQNVSKAIETIKSEVLDGDKFKPQADEILSEYIVSTRSKKELEGERFLPTPLLCANDDGEPCTQLSDPYSFRLTIVIPFWPKRFNDSQFREFMEITLRRETPAHILPRICWLDTCQMKTFEDAYKRWLKTLDIDNDHCDGVAARNALVDVLAKLKSKYPEAQLFSCEQDNTNNNIVILDNTRLG